MNIPLLVQNYNVRSQYPYLFLAIVTELYMLPTNLRHISSAMTYSGSLPTGLTSPPWPASFAVYIVYQMRKGQASYIFQPHFQLCHPFSFRAVSTHSENLCLSTSYLTPEAHSAGTTWIPPLTSSSLSQSYSPSRVYSSPSSPASTYFKHIGVPTAIRLG